MHIYQGGTQRITLRASWDRRHPNARRSRPANKATFLSLGTRVAKRHDRGIPKEGVESYLVDQRPSTSADTYRPQPCISEQQTTDPLAACDHHH